MTRMTHIRYLLFLVFAVFMLSCNELLTAPPGTADVRVSAAPVMTIGETSCLITWRTSVPTKYILEYGTVPGTYGFATVLSASEETNHSVNLTDLEENTLYYYRIKMFYQTYQESLSPEYNFTTTAETPPTIAQRQRGIWIVGGCNGPTFATTVEQVDLFDPLEDRWYPSVTTLPVPVSFAAVGTGTYGGHRVIVVIGGFDSAGNALNTVQRYDVDTNSWLSNGTAMAQPRANVIGGKIYNTVYVMGGTSSAATAGYASVTTNYEYNIGGDSWTTKIAIATGSGKQPVAFNDTLHFMGGRTAAATLATAHEGCLVTTNVLTTATEVVLTSARTGHSVVSYTPPTGPTVFLTIGGFTAFTGTPTSFVFNAGTGGTLSNLVQYIRYPFVLPSAWIAASSTFPSSIAFGTAVAYNNDVYYFGGVQSYLATSGQDGVYTADLTALPALIWSLKTERPMPVGRYGHAAVKF